MQPTNELTRFPDWEDRLSTYLDRVREERFKWGSNDCALFATNAIKAITGHAYTDDVAGTYSTKKEAAETIRKLGHKTYRQAVIARFGKPLHAAQARQGDIVMKGRSTLGVCVGRWSWFVGQDQFGEGLVALPTLDCTSAWRVG